MKKSGIIALLLAVAVAAAAIAGFLLSKPTPANITRKTIKSLGKVTSFKSDVKMDYDGTVSVMGIEADFTLRGDFDQEAAVDTGVSHLKGSVGTKLPLIGDVSLPVESYQQVESSGITVYSSMDGTKWAKSYQENAESENDDQWKDLKMVMGILHLISSGEIKAELAQETEMIGEKEAYRMDITISGEFMMQLLKEVAQAQGDAADILQDLDLTGADAEVVLYILKKEKLPARITIDCTALGNILTNKYINNDTISAKAQKFLITVDAIEYNTVNGLQIPEEVKASAVETEDSPTMGDYVGL